MLMTVPPIKSMNHVPSCISDISKHTSISEPVGRLTNKVPNANVQGPGVTVMWNMQLHKHNEGYLQATLVTSVCGSYTNISISNKANWSISSTFATMETSLPSSSSLFPLHCSREHESLHPSHRVKLLSGFKGAMIKLWYQTVTMKTSHNKEEKLYEVWCFRTL